MTVPILAHSLSLTPKTSSRSHLVPLSLTKEWGRVMEPQQSFCLGGLPFLWVLPSSSQANSSRPWISFRLGILIPIRRGCRSKWVHSHYPACALAGLGAAKEWCPPYLAKEWCHLALAKEFIDLPLFHWDIYEAWCVYHNRRHLRLLPAGEPGTLTETYTCSIPTARLNIICTWTWGLTQRRDDKSQGLELCVQKFGWGMTVNSREDSSSLVGFLVAAKK